MISAVFVDRPRLAIVISVLMTIAGLISLKVIPLAQYPDIVPPQVSVTTAYPARPPPSSNPLSRSRSRRRWSASTS